MLDTMLTWLDRITDRRRGLITFRDIMTEESALRIARGWLLDGAAVRFVHERNGTWTVETWDL